MVGGVEANMVDCATQSETKHEQSDIGKIHL
jgi:hypothetical protein